MVQLLKGCHLCKRQQVEWLRVGAQTSLVVQWLGISYQCRRHGLDAWFGKILHAAGQLSLLPAATEAHAP